jgi:murein DD-endopeptidase MepM/ murein hydrolase activator NlpD
MHRLALTLASGVLALGSLATPTFAQPLFADDSLLTDRILIREGPIAVAPPISDQQRDQHDAQRPDVQPVDEPEMQIAAIGPAMRPLVPQFNAIWPTVGQITTYFGEVGPYSPRGHTGLDIAAPNGTPVLAADEGEVLKAYWDDQGYGGLVIIGHPSGYETWYAHLSRFEVSRGDTVKRGDEIGRMGSTGYSTGPHLHFEVHEDGQLRDPLAFLKAADLKSANL